MTRRADAAFAYLKGIHTLDMSECSQPGITDAAFAHLKGIHTLDMRWCNQEGITDAVFALLKGIQSLDMSDCSQVDITDAALAYSQADVPPYTLAREGGLHGYAALLEACGGVV